MPPSVPTRQSSPSSPEVFGGEIYQHVGRFARGAIVYAFQRIGGADALATWAKDNQTDFYTKLFPRVVTREVEVHGAQRSVDELMGAIDGDYEVVQDAPQQDAPPAWPEYRPIPADDDGDDLELVDFPDE